MDTIQAMKVVEWCFMSEQQLKENYYIALKELANANNVGNGLSPYNRARHKMDVLEEIAERKNITL